MKPEMRTKILAYNKQAAESKKKASDLDVILGALGKLPPGQLKKVLTDDAIAVLEKHGITLT